jgi:hypothetical protein
MKFDLHSRLVAVFGFEPRTSGLVFRVGDGRGRCTGAPSPGARDGHIWRGKKTLLIGNSGDLRRGPPGRDRCGFPPSIAMFEGGYRNQGYARAGILGEADHQYSPSAARGLLSPGS